MGVNGHESMDCFVRPLSCRHNGEVKIDAAAGEAEAIHVVAITSCMRVRSVNLVLMFHRSICRY